MATEPSRLEANRLYWQTDASVAAIAEQMGLSRRALYDLLEAAPAEPSCPECDGPLTFANRLARSTGDAYCTACAVNRAVAAVVRRAARRAAEADAGTDTAGPAQSAPDAGAEGNGNLAPRRAYRDAQPLAVLPPPPRLTLTDLGIAVAAGLAAGLLAAVVFSRRAEP